MSSNSTVSEASGFEVAIIGLAGRFPGAKNVDELWANLLAGKEAIRSYSEEELLALGEEPALVRNPKYVRSARVIDEPELFDAAFFGLSPREAEIMDPQQRLLLECAWETLEGAGYNPHGFPGLIGVFAGARMSSYLLNLFSNPEVLPRVGDLQISMGNDKDYVATRIAYKLSLGGPALSVQTACSTSLVAAHLACQSLISGECDLALAGGVSLKVPQLGHLFREGEILSSDSHIRSFDAGANGTIFSNGLGFVLLKRLSEAERDGDTIYAVIRGSAINNDGGQKVGFSAPGADGQQRVVRAALQMAAVDPATISYVEAHGTGTQVGDPIEVNALIQVFGEHTDKKRFCGLGTIKTNIGHLAAGAGVAALIKTSLALHHERIPASLNYSRPNPQIDFDNSPFFVVQETRDWPRGSEPRRAGVSSFGIGGTNAHAVLEEAPPRPPSGPSRPWLPLLLSARTETALEAMTDRLAAHLEAHPEQSLADVAYTLRVGRRSFEHRRALVCRDRDDALTALTTRDPKRLLGGLVLEAKNRPLAFLFSGQGAQYPGMGRDLYTAEPQFQAEVDRAAELLRPTLGLDLRSLLYPAAGDHEAAAATLAQTRYTQPALFVVEYALARLWMSWGLVPDALLGHSIGEYVAATLAGVFSLEDGLALVAERGRLMQALPAGAMLAVPLSEAAVESRLGPQLAIAAINGPERTVVSGPDDAITAFDAELLAEGIKATRLVTSHAFHSAMMEPILAPFLERVRQVELKAPRIPLISNLTGSWLSAEEATDPAYWVRHLRGRVRFADGLALLLGERRRLLLEVGPGKSLASFAQGHGGRGDEHVILTSLRQAKDRHSNDLAFLLSTLSQIWLSGHDIDWSGFDGDEWRHRLTLPTYPFERQRFWIETSKEGFAGLLQGADERSAAESGKKPDLGDWFYAPCFRPSAPPAAAELGGEPRRWLVVSSPSPLAQSLIEQLERAGQKVSTVEPRPGFVALPAGRFGLAVGAKGDWDQLVQHLAAAGELPEVIVHLLAVGEPPAAPTTAESEAEVEGSFWSLLYLAQALGKQGATAPLRWLVASSHVQQVGGPSPIVPERATLLGPAKVLPLEYPHFKVSAVDIELPTTPDELNELAGRLLAEAATEPTDLVVAYRDGGRFVEDYQNVRLATAPPAGLRLRHGGVYLITGGLGGIGLTLAEALARDYAARLVLLGLSPMPARSEWGEILSTRPAHDRVSLRIRKVQELEAAGAEVLVVAADVTDRAAMGAAIAAALERFGSLHGVVHSAGLAGGGVMQLKNPETAARVLAPKVAGTRILAEVLTGIPLDFLVLCSSTAAIYGPFGQVDYCAANNFLDAFARAAAFAGGPFTLALNWGAWEEVGMAVESGMARAAAKSQEQSAIHPLIDRCLHELAEITIYETDFEPARHWPLGEHHIGGTPALPGTSYLELARAAFEHHAAGFESRGAERGVELRDVFFMTPLLVEEGGSRPTRIVLEREANGFGFRVVSQSGTNAAGEQTWQPHVRGKVRAADDDEAPSHDLAQLLARCQKRETQITRAMLQEGSLVTWGPRWQCLKTIWEGDGEGLAAIELDPQFVEADRLYVLHPALLDVATALLSFLEQESYLPLSYRRVLVRRPLGGRLYSYIRKLEAGKNKETVAADVVLFDATGRELVKIEHFAMKKVNLEAPPSLERVAAAAATPVAAPPAAKPRMPDSGESGIAGINRQEGVEAFYRALATQLRFTRLAVSVRDLEASRKQVRAVNLNNLSGLAGSPKSSGKAQTKHPRPGIPTPFVAPRSPAEERLAELWQGVLGLEQVGIHDNFFDLGGDSVVGVQLIARANEAGFELSPEQLFEHQTVAELALLGGGEAAQSAGEAAAEVPAASAESLEDDLAEIGLSAVELAKALGRGGDARA